MRRFLLGAALVSACFNPKGTAGDSDSSGTATTAAMSATTSSSFGPTTGTSATTTGSLDPVTTATDTATTTTTGLTSETTVVATTDTTTADTTSDTASDSSTTTTNDLCQNTCGPCEKCEAGVCLKLPFGADCQPSAEACDDTIWGAIDGVCYKALTSGGTCDNQGTCVPKCDSQGDALETCMDLRCVRPDHPCQPGAPTAQVLPGSFCAGGGEMTPGCTMTCNEVTGEFESKACQAGGVCETKFFEPCMNNFACIPGTLECHDTCMFTQDCAQGYMCVGGACT